MAGRGRRSGPPRAAQALLSRLLPHRDREAILGDLAEEHARRARTGRWRAHAWYWGEMLRSSIPALRRRVGGARAGTGDRIGDLGRVLSPSEVLRDLRLGIRRLARTPGLALAVVVVLALGIGANASVFTAVHAVLLRPMPHPESDRLVALWPDRSFSRELLAWTREGTSTTVEGVAGYGGALLTLGEGSRPTEIFATEVTLGYLRVLGVAPAQGRGFGEEDVRPGAEPVAVLSHGLWREHFGADPHILGRSVALAGEGSARRTVVGIMPPDHHPLYGTDVEAWIPVLVDPTSGDYGDSFFLKAVGRLRPDTDVEAARAELRAVARSARERKPDVFSEGSVARADVVPLAESLARDFRPRVLVVFGGVFLVLLVACIDVALLLLARTAARRRELAVRAALGAGRARLIRQTVVESLALALTGAGAGLLLAHLVRDVFVPYLPPFVPPETLAVNGVVIVFALVLAVGAALAGGLGPALGAARRDPAGVLASGRGSAGEPADVRLQRFMVAGQLALATTLVTAAALLARSGRQLAELDPGFRPEGVLTFRVTLPTAGHPDDEAVHRFYRRASRALAEAPGVVEAGFVSRLPMGGGTSWITLTPEGVVRAPGEPAPVATHRLVTPGYLEAVDARLRRGRMLEADDTRDEPRGAVVNRTLAERIWAGEEAVGKRLMGPGGTTWLRIVGVVDDLQEYRPGAPPEPAIYIPHTDWAWRSMYGVARVRGDPAARLPALREAIRSVGPNVPVSRVRTLEAVVAARIDDVRKLAWLGTAFSGFALLLGVVGVYGVVAFAVRRRLPELGIRAALGASAGTLVWSELGRYSRIVGLGTVAGLLASLVVGRLLQSFLYRVSAHDPLILGGVALSLGAVGMLAVWLPARRGAGADPVEALRSE